MYLMLINGLPLSPVHNRSARAITLTSNFNHPDALSVYRTAEEKRWKLKHMHICLEDKNKVQFELSARHSSPISFSKAVRSCCSVSKVPALRPNCKGRLKPQCRAFCTS